MRILRKFRMIRVEFRKFSIMLTKLINYIKETKVELKHVNWPSRKKTINFTILVIIFSIGVAIFLGVFDAIFGYLLQKFIL